ncbi:MAG TPA: hypothetical protein VGE98_00115 [Thermoanaerobaculia bacterium]
MTQRSDDDLRARFAALRRADEAGAPPFLRVLAGRPRRSAARPRRTAWSLALGAAAVAALAISPWLLRRSPEVSPGRIETWKPATGFLLDTPSSALYDTLPTLPQPVPDYSPLLNGEKGNTP